MRCKALETSPFGGVEFSVVSLWAAERSLLSGSLCWAMPPSGPAGLCFWTHSERPFAADVLFVTEFSIQVNVQSRSCAASVVIKAVGQ